MSTKYFVEAFHGGQDARIDELTEAIRNEVLSLGVHHSVEVSVTTGPTQGSPAVGVYLGSQAAVADSRLASQLAAALNSGRVIIPVVDSLANFSSLVPSMLTPFNGWEWGGTTPAVSLARRLLEELGIEDRRRRVFISHKRDDGLAAAEQIYDCLAHNGFVPFIDRFGIGIGRDVQNDIADALEDCAFLLLLETPLASSSDWVFDEVEYAQCHQMGMHIVTWPDSVPEIPATNRLPRQILAPGDLKDQKGYQILTDEALEDVMAEVEAIHANALVRRRRYLLRSAEDAAHASGLKCTPMEGWRLLVESSSERTIVQVSTRLPTVEDLHELDQVRSKDTVDMPGVLVHSARLLRAERHDMLSWAVGSRKLTLVPENAVGGYWS